MSQEDRKRYDIEMEDWADQHDKKKKKWILSIRPKNQGRQNLLEIDVLVFKF